MAWLGIYFLDCRENWQFWSWDLAQMMLRGLRRPKEQLTLTWQILYLRNQFLLSLMHHGQDRYTIGYIHSVTTHWTFFPTSVTRQYLTLLYCHAYSCWTLTRWTAALQPGAWCVHSCLLSTSSAVMHTWDRLQSSSWRPCCCRWNGREMVHGEEPLWRG